MKKKFKIFAFLVVTMLVFAACSDSSAPPVTSNAAASSEASTSSKSASRNGNLTAKGTINDGLLVMGTNAAFPPFEFVAENEAGIVGKYDGVDIAIAQKVADKMGVTLEVVDMPFDSLVFALASGKIDFIASGLTATPEREENVDFSEKYYLAKQLIIVPIDNTTITSAKDLDGKIIGVQQSTTGDFLCTDNLPDTTVNRYNSGIEAVIDLKNGKIDAVVIDYLPAQTFVKNDPNKLKSFEDNEFFIEEEYVMAVQKGNAALLEYFDTVILEMKASGEIDQLVEKYSK